MTNFFSQIWNLVYTWNAFACFDCLSVTNYYKQMLQKYFTSITCLLGEEESLRKDNNHKVVLHECARV